jgi:hypothetical protein
MRQSGHAKNSVALIDQFKQDFKTHSTTDAIVECTKLQELQFAVDAVLDDDYKILVGDVDRSDPVRNSRSVVKKSIFRGVSLNGKKWQVSLQPVTRRRW